MLREINISFSRKKFWVIGLGFIYCLLARPIVTWSFEPDFNVEKVEKSTLESPPPEDRNAGSVDQMLTDLGLDGQPTMDIQSPDRRQPCYSIEGEEGDNFPGTAITAIAEPVPQANMRKVVEQVASTAYSHTVT